MKTFLVERDIGQAPMIDIAGLSQASERRAATMRDEGDCILYLGSTYLPLDGRCLCLFQARAAEVVARHSRAAQLPVLRILDALAVGRPAASRQG